MTLGVSGYLVPIPPPVSYTISYPYLPIFLLDVGARVSQRLLSIDDAPSISTPCRLMLSYIPPMWPSSLRIPILLTLELVFPHLFILGPLFQFPIYVVYVSKLLVSLLAHPALLMMELLSVFLDRCYNSLSRILPRSFFLLL